MAKITNEQIVKMIELYEKLGTYAAVARELGVSATTVSRYIKQNQTIKTYSLDTNVPEPTPIEYIPRDQLLSFSTMTIEEVRSETEWRREFNQ